MPASFESFLDEIDAEAAAEGPTAIAQVAFLDLRYQLASAVLTRRRELGLTQKRLAELSGIDQAEISRIEHGQANPTLQTLSSLGRGLQCVLSYVPGSADAGRRADARARHPRARAGVAVTPGAVDVPGG